MRHLHSYCSALATLIILAILAGCTQDGSKKPQAGFTFPLKDAKLWPDTVVTRTISTGGTITVQIKDGFGSVNAPVESWGNWTVTLSQSSVAPDSMVSSSTVDSPDSDGDGVPDAEDHCPGTLPPFTDVNSTGCKGPDTIWIDGLLRGGVVNVVSGTRIMSVGIAATAAEHH